MERQANCQDFQRWKRLAVSINFIVPCLLMSIFNFGNVKLENEGSIEVGVLLIISGLCQILTGTNLLKIKEDFILSVGSLLLAPFWIGQGTLYILVDLKILISNHNILDIFVPGYVAFIVLLGTLSLVALIAAKLYFALLFFNFTLSLVFQTALLFFYEQARWAVSFSLGLEVVFLVYDVVRQFAFKEQTQNEVLSTSTRNREMANSYLPYGHYCHILTTSVFLCHLFQITSDFSAGVVWIFISSLLTVTFGVVLSLRRKDPLSSVYYALSGIFWFSIAFVLLYSMITEKQVDFTSGPLVGSLSATLCLSFILGLLLLDRGLFESINSFFLFFLSLALVVCGVYSKFFEIVASIYFFSAIYSYLASVLDKVSQIKLKFPTGKLAKLKKWKKSLLSPKKFFGFEIKVNQDSYNSAKQIENLGYSKFSTGSHAIAFLANSICALSVSSVGLHGDSYYILSWVLSGSLLLFYSGAISYSTGLTYEGTVYLFNCSQWALWSIFRYTGMYSQQSGISTALGLAAFLVVNLFILCFATMVSRLWFLTFLLYEAVTLLLLLDALAVNVNAYLTMAFLVTLGAMFMYGFLAHALHIIYNSEIIPVGRPLVTLGRNAVSTKKCPHLPARKASSALEIADMMKKGAICGIPTDTVYVLVAACNQPEAVKRAYGTKKQAHERPMSVWISKIEQLEPAKTHFSPLLWDFMNAVWPSSVSLVVKKGEWLDIFGLCDSSDMIGTQESIAIRIPDCTVTTYLIDQVGPIAVTSANPSGEADTTHHIQVAAKLGSNVDGVLCAGPSPENIASTVVDCVKIDQNVLRFFRVGIVPEANVLEIFENVRRLHSDSTSINNLATYDNDGYQENQE